MGIRLISSGGFDKTQSFFERMLNQEEFKRLDVCGQEGVSALSSATPVRTGLTANSWDYKIESSGDRKEIIWMNSNANKNVNIAVILQYGHGTGTGGYVPPIDYINPAMTPVMKKAGDDVWLEVTRK